MTEPVRIPADTERPDRVLANLTGRQLAVLATAAAVLYLAWLACRTLVPPLAFLAAAVPVAAAAAGLALGSRDGLPLDRLALAAVRQRLAPAHRVSAPEGIHPAPAWLTAAADAGGGGGGRVSPVPLRLPAQAVDPTPAGTAGVVDLGGDGLAVLAVCSTVNFALRTPAEQDSLAAIFGRWLQSLTAPVQVLVRAERLDLSGQVAELRERAPTLPHPALEAAAAEHADYLTQLAAGMDLLRRQVLLVLREPAPPTTPTGGLAPARLLPSRRSRPRPAEAAAVDGQRRAAEARLARRLAEAAELLSPAGVTVTGLDPAQATAVLAAACNPDRLIPPGADLATAEQVITTTPDPDDDPERSAVLHTDPADPDWPWAGRWAA